MSRKRFHSSRHRAGQMAQTGRHTTPSAALDDPPRLIEVRQNWRAGKDSRERRDPKRVIFGTLLDRGLDMSFT